MFKSLEQLNNFSSQRNISVPIQSQGHNIENKAEFD